MDFADIFHRKRIALFLCRESGQFLSKTGSKDKRSHWL